MSIGKIFIKRFLRGIPIGVFIGQIFLTLSICIFKYKFEANWEIILSKNIVAGLLGGYCYATSVIYRVDRLSILQQTLIQWGALLVFLPVAWIMKWMPRSFEGIVGFIAFYIIWILTWWIVERIRCRKYVNELNKSLENIKKRD